MRKEKDSIYSQIIDIRKKVEAAESAGSCIDKIIKRKQRTNTGTYQFQDYTKFHLGIFDENHKIKVHKEQFPKDLQSAFEIGCKIAARE